VTSMLHLHPPAPARPTAKTPTAKSLVCAILEARLAEKL
jgi:hypothetical protein